jgi:hypothetical protein
VIKLPQISQEVLYTVLNGMGIPVSQYIKEDGTPALMLGDVAPYFELKESSIMQQADIQRRYQKMIQGVANASVPPTTGTFDSIFIDTNGFHEVALSLMNDAESPQTISRMDLLWSHDGVTIHAMEKVVMPELGDKYRVANTSAKARFFKMRLYNKDSVPHVMNAWAYLKV